MGIRDDELSRLIKYANALGAEVTIKPASPEDTGRAEWDMSGNSITVFFAERGSKLQLILSLIHELGHHLNFIHEQDRKHPKALLRAIEKSSEDKPLTKKQRHLVLKDELAGMRWWEIIYNETGMKFPIYKLYLEREFDTWCYNFWFQVGREPTKQEKKNKLRQLRELFNPHTER